MMGVSTTFQLLLATVFVALFGYGWVREKANAKRWKRLQKKAVSERISSEVRVGKIGENMAPFLKDWPYDPNRFRFLGNPVDGIQFTDDEIIFVEIKTGKSRLSKGQRELRDLVMSGNIRFATFRVGEDGCELKMEKRR